MSNDQKLLFAKGLLSLANMLVAVFIVGLSVTEKDIAAYVPVIGIAAVAGLHIASLVMLREKKLM
jgi:hypothetical protein